MIGYWHEWERIQVGAMCGIAGFWSTLRVDRRAAIQAMISALRHRGPDSHGIWEEHHSNIVLGHRRLAVLDLSPLAHQPMLSRSGEHVIVFNGEIYNFREVRRELRHCGHEFYGTGDTEVLLAAVEQWGVDNALVRLTGMFAFALWNRRQKTLTLARDRLGEKPLYFGWCGKVFCFASELKAIRAHPCIQPSLDKQALSLFLRHSYVPAPHSIYKGIFKLLPGCFLTLRQEDLDAGGSCFKPLPEDPEAGLRPLRYWSARKVCEDGLASPFCGSEADALTALEHKLDCAIKGQMIADVPLGAFLSGGIDSSLIVALMKKHCTQEVKTFSIGFEDSRYNEAHHAAAVAKHLGTEHSELYVSPADMLSVVPLLPELYDEPFSDSSQIPTYLVSRLARTGVTVSLSGDGGDELFAGYPRYLWAQKLWSRLGLLPHQLRRSLGAALIAAGCKRWDWLYEAIKPALPRRFPCQGLGHKAGRLAAFLMCRDRGELYREVVSHWDDKSGVAAPAMAGTSLLSDRRCWPHGLDYMQEMMFLDLVSYLPDDIMAKVDRASMAVSLETRAPFLDHRVVEFIWSLPAQLRSRPGKNKYLLAKLLSRHVPPALTERPKMGFGLPLDDWLRGPLRDWAEELLEPSRINADGYLNPRPIQEKWREHASGKRDWGYPLWDVLMLQSWLRKWA